MLRNITMVENVGTGFSDPSVWGSHAMRLDPMVAYTAEDRQIKALIMQLVQQLSGWVQLVGGQPVMRRGAPNMPGQTPGMSRHFRLYGNPTLYYSLLFILDKMITP